MAPQPTTTTKPERVPPAPAAEPSDPSDAPARTTAPRAAQGENPQLVAHVRGRQAADREGAERTGEGKSSGVRSKL